MGVKRKGSVAPKNRQNITAHIEITSLRFEQSGLQYNYWNMSETEFDLQVL